MLLDEPLCAEDVTFSFECTSSDEEAALAWTSAGACAIVQTEGVKGERVRVTMIQGASPCTLKCTSANKADFLEFSVEKKVFGCDLCGSLWSSCQTCEPTNGGCPNIDHCGICGGDGTACEQCTTTDSTPQQGAVDSAALNHKRFLESLINRASQLQRKKKIKSINPKRIKAWRDLAAPLYTDIWSDVWGKYQGVSKKCTIEGVTSQCRSISNKDVLSRIEKSVNTMRSLGKTIVRTLRRGGLQTIATLRLIRANEALHHETFKQVQNLPQTVQSCWPPEQANPFCS
jgi:hypothetical protein